MSGRRPCACPNENDSQRMREIPPRPVQSSPLLRYYATKEDHTPTQHEPISDRSDEPRYANNLRPPSSSSRPSPPNHEHGNRIGWLEQEVRRLRMTNEILKAHVQNLGPSPTFPSSPRVGRRLPVPTTDLSSLRHLETSPSPQMSPGYHYSDHPVSPVIPNFFNSRARQNDSSTGSVGTSSGQISPCSYQSFGCELGSASKSPSVSSDHLDGGKHVQPVPSGVIMRHEPRRISLSSRPNGGPHVANTVGPKGSAAGLLSSPPPQRPTGNDYQLSEDFLDKEIEFLERRYGGRVRAQRAARLIQQWYRRYRMRKHYDHIRAEKRASRRLENSIVHCGSGLVAVNPSPTLQDNGEDHASMEDLVIERAYLDWRSSVVASDSPHLDRKMGSNEQDSGSQTSVGDGQHITRSRDSGVDADEGGQSSEPSTSGPSASNSTSSMNSAHSAPDTSRPAPPLPTRGPSSAGTLTPAGSAGGINAAVVVTTPTPPYAEHQHSCRHQHHCQQHVHCYRQHTCCPTGVTPVRSTGTLAHQESPYPPYTPGSNSATPPMKMVPSRRPGLMPPGRNVTCCHSSSDKRRKRYYRIGLNIFNKSPLKGIDFLIKQGFVENNATAVARFLITRKGLSRFAIGEYLGSTRNETAVNVTRHFMREIDLRNREVDVALRHLMSHFQTPGESQKIIHILEEFQESYVGQNTALVDSHFRSRDSVLVLAYATLMLHTDLYNPNVRAAHTRMTRDEFVHNLRATDDGEDMETGLLLDVYDRMAAQEMVTLPDHTDQVRKIDENLTGPLKPSPLVLPQRRLVCYCRLYEVSDMQKKERPGAHQRDVFLFNDVMLITKTIQKKKRDGSLYQCRSVVSLYGVQVFLFETQYYPYGIQIKQVLDGKVLASLNTKSAQDRERFVEDLQECVLEMAEMDRLRIEEELGKHNGPSQHAGTPPAQHSGHQRGKSGSVSSEADLTLRSAHSSHSRLAPSRTLDHQRRTGSDSTLPVGRTEYL